MTDDVFDLCRWWGISPNEWEATKPELRQQMRAYAERAAKDQQRRERRAARRR